MKRNLLLIFSIVLVVFLAGAAYYLFFFNITEKRYNKIMCYYITRSLTDNRDNFKERVVAIRDFVNENVQPIHGYHNRLDTLAIEKLTSGIGWCDQGARVFMQLARSIGITSRLLFLRLESGSSPHSIAEALAPDGRWVIVDPQYKLDLINKDGELASQSDIRKNLNIIRDNKKVKSMAEFEKRWADPQYLAIYSNPPIYVTTKKGVKVDFLKFVPLRLIRPVASIISNRYLNQIAPGIKNIYEFKMLKARTLHLLGYYEKSGRLYDEIVASSGDLPLIRKAGFYKAVLLKDQKRYDETQDYITDTINKDTSNPYIGYLRGLRTRLQFLRIKYSIVSSKAALVASSILLTVTAIS